MSGSSKLKIRGRPTNGRDPFAALKLSRKTIAELEKWAIQKGDMSRAAAIRRLVEEGLALARQARPHGKKATTDASNMAGREIDRLGDPFATAKERGRRKRRLLKGPVEFRNIRKRRKG